MRWGLIPSWWSKRLKEMKIATFNAPAETITDKPMFRDALGRPEITPHNWDSEQSRAGMPDEGTS
jgi:hypothetical protein